jgi:hypothetical protein
VGQWIGRSSAEDSTTVWKLVQAEVGTVCRWHNMKSSPLRAAILSAAVWVLCIVAMVVSGAILLVLAQQSEALRRKREYCDDSVRTDGLLPTSCCTAETLNANGQCEVAEVRPPTTNLRYTGLQMLFDCIIFVGFCVDVMCGK